jgi:hypothetical protein
MENGDKVFTTLGADNLFDKCFCHHIPILSIKKDAIRSCTNDILYLWLSSSSELEVLTKPKPHGLRRPNVSWTIGENTYGATSLIACEIGKAGIG